jgi:superfamily II DNA helicase RecQ
VAGKLSANTELGFMLSTSQDILSGKFRVILISPEIANLNIFRTGVLSKPEFNSHIRVVCVDECHCISLWGGSFCPDYAKLALIHSRFPRNVPFLVTSATLPEHILDDIQTKLQLSSDVKMVQLLNTRPNIALSCRQMHHPDDTKADLQFLIPPGARRPEDIGITLIYCNQCTVTEDITDRVRVWLEAEGIPTKCVGFYHVKVGEKRKQELEELLQTGVIQILICTDAVGMVRQLEVCIIPCNTYLPGL